VSTDRVFVDTNVLISGLIFRHGKEAALLELADKRAVGLVLCARVIAEAQDVFDGKFTDRIQVLTEFLQRGRYELAPEPGEADLQVADRLVRDPNDVVILASILASKPDVALTGDKDLLTDEVKAVAPTCRCAEYLAKREEAED
jgi:putative PIN family toxin of toxin-antitoxin system